MAAGVVDDLELIDVEVTQRVARLARLRALERALDAALELTPVDEAGEQIVRGVVGKATIELAALRDVVEHEHATRHLARAVANGRRRAFDIQLVAIAANEQHRAHALDGPRAADRHRQRILERLAGLLVEGAVDLFDGPTHRVLEPPARELLGHGIDVIDRAVRIRRHDAVTDGLQRDLRGFLLAEQRLLVELAFGDVELDTHEPQQAAMFIDARLGAAHHPAPVAIAMTHAMHAFENGALAGDMIADRALHARHVFRVHEAAPVGRIQQRVGRITEHLLPARREMDLVALDVEIPEAVVGRALREFDALFERVQPLFDAQTFEARGKRIAEELQQQLQVHIPRATRQCVSKAQYARRLPLHAQADEQYGADRQLRES